MVSGVCTSRLNVAHIFVCILNHGGDRKNKVPFSRTTRPCRYEIKINTVLAIEHANAFPFRERAKDRPWSFNIYGANKRRGSWRVYQRVVNKNTLNLDDETYRTAIMSLVKVEFPPLSRMNFNF